MEQTKRKKTEKPVHEKKGLEFENWIVSMRRQGQSVQTLIDIVTHAMDGFSAQQILTKAKEVELICRSFQSYDMVEQFIASDAIKVADRDETFVVNEATKRRMVLKPSSILPLFDSNYLYKKVRHLYDVYNPRTSEVYLNIAGQLCFNLYCPPNWRADTFYGNKKLIPCEMPPIYQEFLWHLVSGDQESYDYLLKWLANSLNSRNYCYLLTVGKMGIGKGLLFEITSRLHGLENSAQTLGDTFFKTSFNSDLENITLYYINEVSKLNDRDLDRLKMLVESKIRLEKKGQHAKEMDNHINTMISSNDITALPVVNDDRRFSIITLTTIPTLQLWPENHDEKIKEMLDPENIAKLGTYLLTRVQYTNTEMMKAFKSKAQMREIKSAALQDWEDYFLFQYCKDRAGQTVSILDVAKDVRDATNNNRARVSMRAAKSLKERFPGFFVVRATKRPDGTPGTIGLGFAELDKQPPREQFNLEVVETEDAV